MPDQRPRRRAGQDRPPVCLPTAVRPGMAGLGRTTHPPPTAHCRPARTSAGLSESAQCPLRGDGVVIDYSALLCSGLTTAPWTVCRPFTTVNTSYGGSIYILVSVALALTKKTSAGEYGNTLIPFSLKVAIWGMDLSSCNHGRWQRGDGGTGPPQYFRRLYYAHRRCMEKIDFKWSSSPAQSWRRHCL